MTVRLAGIHPPGSRPELCQSADGDKGWKDFRGVRGIADRPDQLILNNRIWSGFCGDGSGFCEMRRTGSCTSSAERNR